MKSVLLAVMIACLGYSFSYAAFSKNDAGTSAAQFLKLGAGARTAGMGGASAAAAEGADGIYWNPAVLAAIEGGEVSVMHAAWFEGITYDWAACAQRIQGIGTVGVGVQYLSYGSITTLDNTGLDTGSMNPNDAALSLSWAKSMKRFALGVNVKYISSTITKTATAFAADLGATYRCGDRLAFGAVAQNMGTALKYDTESDPLPLNLKAGAAYAITNNWKLALDVNAPIDNAVYGAVGTEYRYQIAGQIDAFGRVGYNSNAQDAGGLSGLGGGLGLRYLAYTMDYAFVPYGDLGDTHRVSLSMKW